MGLSQTRKIISCILAVLTALMTAALIISSVLGFTLSSRAFTERVIAKGELVSQCEKQLDSKYASLEAESGIPSRVFLQVKTDYSISDSLKRAIESAYNGENATLYNQGIVDYFSKLCTEFLEGSKLEYNKNDVERTAKKAAEIYSETVGIHGAEVFAKHMRAVKDIGAKCGLVSFMVILLAMLITVVIYSSKTKGLMYVAAGLTGGGLATALSGVLCFAFRVWRKIILQPEVFAQAVRNTVKTGILLTIPAGLAVAAAMYVVFILLFKKAEAQENER